MANYHTPLLPENTYHLFSRANGNELLFLNDNNYQFFLDRFQKHTVPVANTLAFCLLPNHFHILVQIKTVKEIKDYYEEIKAGESYNEEIQAAFIMKKFSNCLNSYTK